MLNWIDEHACAVAAMVYRIALAAKVEITPAMATCLYTAILSDTGSFTYSSTNAETLLLAHDLTGRGANPSQIARDVYFNPPARSVSSAQPSIQPPHRRPTPPGPGSPIRTWTPPARKP